MKSVLVSAMFFAVSLSGLYAQTPAPSGAIQLLQQIEVIEHGEALRHQLLLNNLQKVYPPAVKTEYHRVDNPIPGSKGTVKMQENSVINPENLIPLIIKCINDQQQMIRQQQETIEALRREMDVLRQSNEKSK